MVEPKRLNLYSYYRGVRLYIFSGKLPTALLRNEAVVIPLWVRISFNTAKVYKLFQKQKG